MEATTATATVISTNQKTTPEPSASKNSGAKVTVVLQYLPRS